MFLKILNFFASKKRFTTILALGLVIICFAFLFTLFSDKNRDTKIWITNSSEEQVKVVVGYTAHETCPGDCKLELGNFSINERRGTSFPTPGEGNFYMVAEFNDGRTLTSEHNYTEGWKFHSIILKDKIETK